MKIGTAHDVIHLKQENVQLCVCVCAVMSVHFVVFECLCCLHVLCSCVVRRWKNK